MDDNSEPGIRALADDIAQTRPGPMMMHVLRHDPAAAALADGYRLLYSLQAEEAPRSTSLFIYCQPYRVKGTSKGDYELQDAQPDYSFSRNTWQQHTAERASVSSPLDVLFQEEESVLPWVAATERFAEQVELRLQQSARDEDQPDEEQGRQQSVAMDIVDKLRASVARHATDARSSNAPPNDRRTSGGAAGAGGVA